MTFSMAVQQIRELAADDITHIVADHVQLKRSGRGMKGLCPFHDEKTPSFHVSDERGIYKCFGCGLGGDAIDFVMRMEGKEFHETIFQLADRFHITIDQNHRDRQTSRIRKESESIPNIKEIRSEIRKDKKVVIVLNGGSADVFETKAITSLSPPLTSCQARILRKYTDRCILVVDGLEWATLKKTVQAALTCGLFASIWDGKTDRDWLRYIVVEKQPIREEIIKLLAIIPDGIARSIYMGEYSNLLNKMNELET